MVENAAKVMNGLPVCRCLSSPKGNLALHASGALPVLLGQSKSPPTSAERRLVLTRSYGRDRFRNDAVARVCRGAIAGYRDMRDRLRAATAPDVRGFRLLLFY